MQYAKPVTLKVEECDRLSFLPYLCGNDFLYAEASVYALAKKMMRFALPLMLSGNLQLLFNAADTIVVGQVPDTYLNVQ